jgi:hypothetical protein
MKNNCKGVWSQDPDGELRRMGCVWFVLRAYWAYVDPKERRWEGTRTLAVRCHAFRRTYDIMIENVKLHKQYLKYIIEKANAARLNHNNFGISAEEVRKLAKEILSTNPELDLIVSRNEL